MSVSPLAPSRPRLPGSTPAARFAPRGARARGATLAELLAALLVLAVGAIGIAAVYLDNATAKPESALHREAVALADSIAARIAENAEGRVGYASTVGVVCREEVKQRSPQQAAAHEASCWEAEVKRRLPSGLGSITRDLTTTPVSYVVAVSWSAPESGAASYVIRVQSEQATGS